MMIQMASRAWVAIYIIMQNNIDLMVAYANKIALGLAMKEHAVNQKTIEQEGRTVYGLNMLHSSAPFRKYTGPSGNYNAEEIDSLCNNALEMVQAGMKINNIFSRRSKMLIESAFSRSLTVVKEENVNAEGVKELPVESLKQLDMHSSWSQQKIRHFVITNYRKTPYEIRSLIRSLNVPIGLVKEWIRYSEKNERLLKLREGVIELAMHQTVTLDDFKKMARKIHRTKLFRATDDWCLNYIRKNRLENLVNTSDTIRQT